MAEMYLLPDTHACISTWCVNLHGSNTWLWYVQVLHNMLSKHAVGSHRMSMWVRTTGWKSGYAPLHCLRKTQTRWRLPQQLAAMDVMALRLVVSTEGRGPTVTKWAPADWYADSRGESGMACFDPPCPRHSPWRQGSFMPVRRASVLAS